MDDGPDARPRRLEGAPLVDDDPGAGDRWAARHVAKNANVVPEFVELRREIADRRDRLVRRLHAHREWLAGRSALLRDLPAERILDAARATTDFDARVESELVGAVAELNTLVARHNLRVPFALQIAPLALEHLRERESRRALGGPVSSGADERGADGRAPPVIDEGVAVARDLSGRAPAVREVQPPVAELVEIEETDHLAASAEEDARRTPSPEVDDFAERPKGLRDLDDDLGMVPVREGLQVRAGAVTQWLHRDGVAGRRGQPTEGLAHLQWRVRGQSGAHRHGTKGPTRRSQVLHLPTVRTGPALPSLDAEMAKKQPFRYDAESVVRAGTSRPRGPGSEPETVRTGTASAE